MSFGPDPWRQTSWDGRAAGNFIGGGLGCGLIVATALSGAQGPTLALLMLAGLAFVGLGLFSVFLEIGRPLRAARVIMNPRRSWMSREALAGAVLMPLGLGAAAGMRVFVVLAALAALVFLYCQVRILQAAKGIPAWREPMTVPLLLATGLAEGFGIFWLAAPWHGLASPLPWALFGALLALRYVLRLAWRRRLAGRAAPAARRAVDEAGHVFDAGTLLPLVIVLGVLATPLGAPWLLPLQALAGLLAAVSGAWFKYSLVTRAAYNQGYALAHLPVRGVPR